MSSSLASLFRSARQRVQRGALRQRSATCSSSRRSEAEIRYQTSETLETRTLLAAQLVASDMTSRTIDAGETFEVEVRYQTLDDNGNPATLKSNLIGFNLLFDSSQIEWLETPTNTIFTEGATVIPTEVRQESEDQITNDNDPNTDSALVASYSDNDPLFNPGWPNNIESDGFAVYTARFRALDTFTGTTIRFTANAVGNVVGQNAAFDFESRPLELLPPSTPSEISISDATAVEGSAAAFTVSLDAASDETVTVQYSTADGAGPEAATAGADYTAQTNQTVTFAPGQTSQTIQIQTTDDALDETDEFFLINLSNADGATIATSQATGTITDNDETLPTVSIADASAVVEGNSAVFTVTLSEASDSPISVSYSTADSTGPNAATAGTDYTALSNQSLTFSPGQTSLTIEVMTTDDAVDEDSEEFLVNLNSAPGATIASGQATGTITDNDEPVLPTLSVSDAGSVVEGQPATFTVSLSEAANSTVTVSVSTLTTGPTAATSGTDFTEISNQTVTFAAGQTSQTVTVSTIDDSLVESTEDFSVVLSGAVGATILDANGVGSITDNDATGENGTGRVRKFNDLNGDGERSADEPWLNGWTIQLLNANQDVVAEVVTTDVDVNGDQVLDPETESGWALFDVAPGTYTVREVAQAGWVQTTPVASAAAAAYLLDQNYDFKLADSDFEDWGGLGERWIFSNDGWFFITPDGELFQWDNSPADNLSGQSVGTLSPAYHDDLTLLVDVPEATVAELTVVTNQESDVLLFGNRDITVPGSISGRKWNDLNGDGQRTDDEPWLNGWTIELLDARGTVVQTTTTQAVDLNNDGTIDPVAEAGVYSFDDLNAGTYSVREVAQDHWIQTSPFSAEDVQAYDVDSRYELEETGNLFENWGGLSERWLRGADQWYYITPDGSLYRWNNSPSTDLSGELVEQLDVRYYNDPGLLADAVDPRAAVVHLAIGETRDDVYFGNQLQDQGSGDFAGEGNVRVRVVGSTLILNGDGSANGVHVFLNQSGYVTVGGLGDTTINGESEMVMEGWTSIGTDLRVSLAGGDDALVVSDMSIGRNMSVNTGGGDDTVIVRDSSIAGGMSAVDLSGDNTLIAVDSQIMGATSISMGNGVDLVHLHGVTASTTTVNVRGGDDGIVAEDTAISGTLRVSMGAGNDRLAAIGANQMTGRTIIDGQSGTDAVSASSETTFASEPILRRIDSDDANPDDLLDQIMQRLADAGLDDLV